MPLEAGRTEAKASLARPSATASTVRRSSPHSELLTPTMGRGSIRQRQDDGLQWIRWRRSTTAPRRMRSATTIR